MNSSSQLQNQLLIPPPCYNPNWDQGHWSNTKRNIPQNGGVGKSCHYGHIPDFKKTLIMAMKVVSAPLTNEVSNPFVMHHLLRTEVCSFSLIRPLSGQGSAGLSIKNMVPQSLIWRTSWGHQNESLMNFTQVPSFGKSGTRILYKTWRTQKWKLNVNLPGIQCQLKIPSLMVLKSKEKAHPINRGRIVWEELSIFDCPAAIFPYIMKVVEDISGHSHVLKVEIWLLRKEAPMFITSRVPNTPVRWAKQSEISRVDPWRLRNILTFTLFTMEMISINLEQFMQTKMCFMRAVMT